MQKKKTYLLLFFMCVLFIFALVYRLYGLQHNDPFWIDEYATADQATLIASRGFHAFFNSDNPVEHHNITTYSLVALFFKLFGRSEFIARLPFAIIGSLVPVAIFIVCREFFSTEIGTAASILAAFSYFQITWSRQARAYMLIQLLVLLTYYFYRKMLIKKKATYFDILCLCILFLVGILTHSFYILFILAILTDYVFEKRATLKQYFKKTSTYILFALFLFIFYITGTIRVAMVALITAWHIHVNNLWYYHSFLWRQYGMITLMALLGTLIFIAKKKKDVKLIGTYILFHLLFVCFIYAHYISKYLLPLFPFVFILVAVALDSFFQNIQYRKIFLVVTTIFIIISGDKFVIKPKQYYSVNHDFREIAIIDYKQIYDIVKNKSKSTSQKIAMIDTWPARPYWYLGQDYAPLYILRWKQETIAGNGQKITRTSFTIGNSGEKIVPKNRGLRLIEDVSDLKRTIDLYPKGFIFIDDATLPSDVIDYAQKNFKKELYLDHYPLDDNPYSIWPATLYSWGFEK